jgi:DNA-directed RNA polymerase specialized sigma24 family protein
MHPVILQQLAAEHRQQMLAEADDARRAQQARRARPRRPPAQVRRPGRARAQRESEPVTAATAANMRPSCPPARRSLAMCGPEDRAASTGLTDRQRAVFVLRVFDDLSEVQVAEMLGCPAGTVRSTMSRALARLREDVQLAEFMGWVR